MHNFALESLRGCLLISMISLANNFLIFLLTFSMITVANSRIAIITDHGGPIMTHTGNRTSNLCNKVFKRTSHVKQSNKMWCSNQAVLPTIRTGEVSSNWARFPLFWRLISPLSPFVREPIILQHVSLPVPLINVRAALSGSEAGEVWFCVDTSRARGVTWSLLRCQCH